MTWSPVAHSAQTDVAALPVLFDAEHAPIEFTLDAQDLAHAAAARHHLRKHLDRLNALPDLRTRPVDKA